MGFTLNASLRVGLAGRNFPKFSKRRFLGRFFKQIPVRFLERGGTCRCGEALSGAWRLAPGEGNKVLLGGLCVYFSIRTLLHLENVANIAFYDFL